MSRKGGRADCRVFGNDILHKAVAPMGIEEVKPLLACRACLAVDRPLWRLQRALATVYGELTGTTVSESDIYPKFLCSFCRTLLAKFAEFKKKCLSVEATFLHLHSAGVSITSDLIKSGVTGAPYPNFIQTYIQIISKDPIDGCNTINKGPKIHETEPEVKPYLLFNGKVEEGNMKEENSDTDCGLVEDMDVESMEADADDLRDTSSDCVDPDIYDGSIDGCNTMNNGPKIHETDPEVQPSYLLFNGKVEEGNMKEENSDTDCGLVEDMDVESMEADADDLRDTSSDCVDPDIYDASIDGCNTMNNGPKIHETDPEVQPSYLLFNGKVEEGNMKEENADTDCDLVEDMDVESMEADADDLGDTSSDCVDPDIYDGSYTLLLVGDNAENIIPGGLTDITSDIKQESTNHKETKISIVQKKRNVPESQNNLGANSSKISLEKIKAKVAAVKAKNNAIDGDISTKRGHTSLEKIRAEIAKLKAKNLRPLQESKMHTDKWLVKNYNRKIFDTKILQWEEDFNVKVVQLSKEDQIKQTKARKEKKRYLDAAYQCEFCYRGFSDRAAFLKHMERHDPSQGEYVCDVCSMRYRTRSVLNGHVATYHLYDLICNECGFVSKSTTQAGAHDKSHKGVKYDCKICGKLFTAPGSLAKHIQTKHGSDLKCSVCGDTFHTDKGLRTHFNLSHKKAMFAVCPDCGMQFNSEDALRTHRPLDGPCDQTLRACAACGEGFGSEELLEQHKLDKHSVTYQCDLCSKRFDTRSKHKSHMIRHQQATICEVCGCTKSNKYVLEVHRRQVHGGGEKPFQCDHCGHRSSTKQSLAKHIMYTHMGMKRPPFKTGQCRLCAKKYKYKSNLRRHELFVHKKVRPHQCEICAKTYQERHGLQTHIDTKHRGMPWPKRVRDRKRRRLPDDKD